MVIQKIILGSLKNLITSFKNLNRLLTGEEKILGLSFKNILLSFLFLVLCFSINVFSFDKVFADSNLNYSVSVEPALNITTSSSKVSLDLNPLTHDFDSQNLQVSVSTNNETGYKLYVNTSTTDLVEKNDSNLTIKTLDSEKSESEFTVNKWGYKINTENYLPFKSGILLNYKYTAIENDVTNLTFAAKVDYDTKAGSYTLPLNFQATANPNIRYMQNFTNEDCKILASDNSYTVYDLRDENDYQVRYINGNCWMVQNLRYVGDIGSLANQMVMKANTSNIDVDKTITYEDLTAGNSYDTARIHDSGNATTGVWYNYAAASAMTITGASNNNTATEDVCPRNWRVPTQTEFNSIISHKITFDPIASGGYNAGSINTTDGGFWWSATPYKSDNTMRYRIRCMDCLNDSLLVIDTRARVAGDSVRCIRSN